MGQATNRPSIETIDLVITNALIVDWAGIYKVQTIPLPPLAQVSFTGRPISESKMVLSSVSAKQATQT